MNAGFAVIFAVISVFIFTFLAYSCTSKGPDELVKNITVIGTIADEEYTIVSNEPKIYKLRFVKDFAKIQKGKTYRVYIILNNSNHPQIYDVGPEVIEGTK